MGQNVIESIASFLISIDNGFLVPALSFLDTVMDSNQVEQFSTKLERIIEWDGRFSQYQLKVRDIIAEYLGIESVYFALGLPSYSILKMVADASNKIEARTLLSDVVHEKVKNSNSEVDLSCIEIDTLMDTPYIVLTPYVLTNRVSELESCKIYYSVYSSGGREKYRYCISELLKTHYGRKIVNAFKFDPNYPIIGSEDFLKLSETLHSFGHDGESNLEEISPESWPYAVTKMIRSVEQDYMWSTELWLLYKTYLAMVRLGSDDTQTQETALKQIQISKTKNCNDALVSLAATGTSSLQMMAIDMLESSSDSSRVDYLCNLIPVTEGATRKRLAKAISVIESAQYFTSPSTPALQPTTQGVPDVRIPEKVDEYLTALAQLSNSSSTHARIDAVRALSVVKIPGVETHLLRLMNDEDSKVRLAVLNASLELPKEQAVSLIQKGLQDTDATVENKALRLFEDRWPDSYW